MSCIEAARDRRLRRIVAVTCTAAALFTAPAAQAVLGGDASTIGDDELRLKGLRRQSAVLRPQILTREIAMADGSSIREFVAPNGIVFAVAWSTRFKPNLESLLGTHAAGYAAAASEALRAPGIRRSVVLQRGDLVVHSTTHLNVFVGKAYLRSLVPQGVGVDELR
jgi:hypothetical protein